MTFLDVRKDIYKILKNNTESRSDDMKLYLYYAAMKTERHGLGLGFMQRVFGDPIFRISHGIAPYESVSRTRRQLQAEFEELRPAQAAIEEKKRLEKKYRAYFRKQKAEAKKKKGRATA